MITFVWGNALWHLIVQSDGITKCVLGILLLFSVASWTVFLYKLILLNIKKRHLRRILMHMKTVTNIDELREMVVKYSHTVPGYFLASSISFLKSILQTQKQKTTLNEQEFALFQDHVDQILEETMHGENAYMAILFGSAQVSPLLGLFGTVWGLIHAFIEISQQQTADIATIAPGIAEALITTLVGLMVAIPSLLMYVYLSSNIRSLEHYYAMICDRLNILVRKFLVKQEAFDGTTFTKPADETSIQY